VPAHWNIADGRRVFGQTRVPAKEDDEQLSSTQRYGVIPQQIFMAKEDQKVVLALGGIGNFKHVDKNDFVISLRSFQGGIERCHYSGCVSPAYTVLKPLKNLEPRFWEFLLKSSAYISVLQSVTDGIRDGKTVRYEQFGSVPLPLPPSAEQAAIAAFLERETGKIDALVEAQTRLIELLKEKRQAVISHAVTKGLDPAAPMKDSGVEWLGQVPAHWEVCLLKRAFDGTQYGISESLEADGAVAVLRMGNIEGGRVSFDDLKFVETVDSSLLLHPGDLLFNRTNSLDQIGKVGMVRNIPEHPVTFASYLVRLRLKDDCVASFMSFLLNTRGALGQARARAFVAIGQCNLNPTRYGEMVVVLPPREEQALIAADLQVRTAKLDALVHEAESAILMLSERRSALISAAVTGKIDVRGLVPEQAEAA